jgi:spore germination cell wall hydrolase CwlJ-like protein
MITTLTCMAVAIYFEARGELIDGQMMVAETILNRAADPRWPDEPCDVIAQPKQFSFYEDRRSNTPRDMEAYTTAVLVAAEALDGKHASTGALYYHTTAVRPVWRHDLQPIGLVGDHIFYANTKDCRLPTCSPRPVPRPERQQ